MTPFERLVTFITSQYRWGLHPLKMLGALLIPVGVVWSGDRYLRWRASAFDSGRDKLDPSSNSLH